MKLKQLKHDKFKYCRPISSYLIFFKSQTIQFFLVLRRIIFLNVKPITLHVDGHATLELVYPIKDGLFEVL